MRKIVFIMLIVAPLLFGCSNSKKNTTTIASTPIKLGVAGSHAELEIEVNNEDSNKENKILVGIYLPQEEEKKIEKSALRGIYPNLGVTITRLSPLGFSSVFRYYRSPDISKKLVKNESESVVAYAQMYSSNNFFVAAIDRSTNGKYRISLEVIDGTPSIQDVNFELFVGHRSYGGK